MPMNKEDAAAFLGVSVRALQRYAAAGKLSVTYTKGPRGQVAEFSEEELTKFKEQLETPLHRPAVTSTDTPDQQAVIPVTAAPLVPQALGEKLVSALEALQPRPTTVAIEHKLILTLLEASSLCGLSKNFLRDAIKGRKLKAQLIGKGWKIKRSDLEAYVKKL